MQGKKEGGGNYGDGNAANLDLHAAQEYHVCNGVAQKNKQAVRHAECFRLARQETDGLF